MVYLKKSSYRNSRKYIYIERERESVCVCVCVCVWEREREGERVREREREKKEIEIYIEREWKRNRERGYSYITHLDIYAIEEDTVFSKQPMAEYTVRIQQIHNRIGILQARPMIQKKKKRAEGEDCLHAAS